MQCDEVDLAVAQLAEDRLSETEQQALELHCANCADCRQLAALCLTIESGQTLGRFVLAERLGEGGMGVVFLAQDTVLERQVAVKVVRPKVEMSFDADRKRLVREAKAMARLTHPNVVSLYDAGTAKGQVFLAMELMTGGTLQQWLRAQPRTAAQILSKFIEVGQGLGALHDANLVHRDFKPANVLLTPDGTPKVADLGLVSRRTEPPGEQASVERSPGGPRGAAGEVSASTTLFGGTPRYMAPEQLVGLGADTRSDQYSFCLALYEALFECLPGEPAPPKTRRAVPSRVRRALSRGMSHAPAARFDSMEPLLDQLRQAVRPRARWPWALAGSVAMAAVVLAHVVSRPVCTFPQERLSSLTSAQVGSRLAEAFSKTGSPFASETARIVTGALRSYAQRWGDEHVQACEATHERHEQSESALDHRMQCLAVRLQRAQSLVDVLHEADEAVVARAGRAVSSLEEPSVCRDPEMVRARYPKPQNEKERAALDQLRARLAEAAALHELGRVQEANRRVAAMEPQVVAAGRPALRASWLRLQATVAAALGELERAQGLLKSAASQASEAADDHGVAEALSRLSWITAKRGQFDAAQAYVAAAEALLGRWPEHAWIRRGVLVAKQEIYGAQGDSSRALALAQQEAELARHNWGTQSIHFLKATYNAALAASNLGKIEPARKGFEAARTGFTHVLGANHPTMGWVSNALGEVERKAGRGAAARTHYRRALEVFRGAYGSKHISLSYPHNNLGVVALNERQFDEASKHFSEALQIRLEVHGPEHISTALIHENIGLCHRGLQRWEQARASLLRSAALFRQAESKMRLAHVEANLGIVALDTGHPAQAAKHYERSVALWAASAPEHPEALYPEHGLAAVAAAQGRYASAVKRYEQTLEQAKKHPGLVLLTADVRFGLAQALRARGEAAARARSLASEALEAYQAQRHTAQVTEVRRWLNRGN